LNYYSVFDKYGKKIADCAALIDAITLINFDKSRTYRQVKYVNPETINVAHIKLADDLQLPAQQILPQSDLEPFIV
jgi:hypothetical protein